MIAFPGGFGTMDELFEALTLIQTHRMQPMPIVLFGRDYWSKLVDWQMFVDEGTIAPEDLELVHFAETAQECWQIIADFYSKATSDKLPRGQ
jgi:predicted Rossmann-fold nucleotide-binding protein